MRKSYKDHISKGTEIKLGSVMLAVTLALTNASAVDCKKKNKEDCEERSSSSGGSVYPYWMTNAHTTPTSGYSSTRTEKMTKPVAKAASTSAPKSSFFSSSSRASSFSSSSFGG
jgi:hypothetical protein